MKNKIVTLAFGVLLIASGCNKKNNEGTETAEGQEPQSYVVKGNVATSDSSAQAQTGNADAANTSAVSGPPSTGVSAGPAPSTQAQELRPFEPAVGEEVTLRGKVTEVTPGKDGYSAKLKLGEGQFYTATVSIPNMKDPKQYKKVNVGEMVTVTGSFFKLGKDNAVKVTVFE